MSTSANAKDDAPGKGRELELEGILSLIEGNKGALLLTIRNDPELKELHDCKHDLAWAIQEESQKASKDWGILVLLMGQYTKKDDAIMSKFFRVGPKEISLGNTPKSVMHFVCDRVADLDRKRKHAEAEAWGWIFVQKNDSLRHLQQQNRLKQKIHCYVNGRTARNGHSTWSHEPEAAQKGRTLREQLFLLTGPYTVGAHSIPSSTQPNGPIIPPIQEPHFIPLQAMSTAESHATLKNVEFGQDVERDLKTFEIRSQTTTERLPKTSELYNKFLEYKHLELNIKYEAKEQDKDLERLRRLLDKWHKCSNAVIPEINKGKTFEASYSQYDIHHPDTKPLQGDVILTPWCQRGSKQ
ncbi:MAG: hypothetical protein Q9226_005767 [Calogaya cf. arnoldii]